MFAINARVGPPNAIATCCECAPACASGRQVPLHAHTLADAHARIHCLRGGLTSPLLSPRHDAVILSDEYLSSGEAFSPVASRPASVCGTPATDGHSPLLLRGPPTLSRETLAPHPSPPPRTRSPAGSGGTARVRAGDSAAAEAAAAARQAQVDADLLHAARQTPDRCAAGGVEAPGAQPLPHAPGGCVAAQLSGSLCVIDLQVKLLTVRCR